MKGEYDSLPLGSDDEFKSMEKSIINNNTSSSIVVIHYKQREERRYEAKQYIKRVASSNFHSIPKPNIKGETVDFFKRYIIH